MRDFLDGGRSPVMASEAMAATSHPLATSAALQALREGGNAVDAAVTAAAVLCVVEPAMTGIGGDGFAIIATPDGRLHGVNGSGRAPAGATRMAERLRAAGHRTVPGDAPEAVTVPGVVAAWDLMLRQFGGWDLARCLRPAIHYARNGFPVAPRVARDWGRVAEKLARDPGAARHYLKHRAVPEVGDVMRQEALAATLETIARDGVRGFYEGPVAEDIVATLRARGNAMSLEDLAAVDPFLSDPVVQTYRDVAVAELPPNGQGITALILLNILETFDLAGLDPSGPERLHLELEAARLAYACRDAFIADPGHMRVSIADLVGKAQGRRLAARIDPARALTDVTPGPVPSADTIYLTVVDRDRRAVSLINSIFHAFGSGIVTEKTGITLQNRGACFTLEEGHANEMAGDKRPLHTIIPGFMLKEGRPTMPFGVMGGAYQACGHAHFIANMVDFGMDPQAAIDAPRAFFSEDWATLLAEHRLPEAVLAGLAARGHRVEASADPIGGGQAIFIDHARGVLIGGSESRKDGLALGY